MSALVFTLTHPYRNVYPKASICKTHSSCLSVFSLQSRYTAAGDKTPCRKSSSQSPAQNQTVLRINFAQALSVIISHQCVLLTLVRRLAKHKSVVRTQLLIISAHLVNMSFDAWFMILSFSGTSTNRIKYSSTSKVRNYNYVETKLVTVCSNAVQMIIIM